MLTPDSKAESVLSMLVDPLSQSYPTPEALLQFYGAIEEELKGIPELRERRLDEHIASRNIDQRRIVLRCRRRAGHRTRGTTDGRRYTS